MKVTVEITPDAHSTIVFDKDGKEIYRQDWQRTPFGASSGKEPDEPTISDELWEEIDGLTSRATDVMRQLDRESPTSST